MSVEGQGQISGDSSLEEVLELGPKELVEKIDQGVDIRLVDVRDDWEIKIAKLPNSEIISHAVARKILSEWKDSDCLIVFYCHYGIRSRGAAEYFLKQGVRNVRNLSGGLEYYAKEVDPSLPRY